MSARVKIRLWADSLTGVRIAGPWDLAYVHNIESAHDVVYAIASIIVLETWWTAVPTFAICKLTPHCG